MTKAKFKPGEVVELVHGDRIAPRGGLYEIVRPVHTETGEFQYRVRSLTETVDPQLVAAAAPA
jgi:hypothetical protein